ncbi:hypothetical protein [Nocardia sp. NPDC057030]|uniref:hypothetical protein n=1 Tax=Nocardia sp. NPDC057030 TaxID=3346005 RepID=UPI00362FDBDD
MLFGTAAASAAVPAGLPLEPMTPTEYDQRSVDDIDASFGSFKFTGPPECWFRPISGRAVC